MAKKKSNVTIKDIAREAGVSVATVGRVIGNYGNVSEDTRQKVMQVASELNFVPNMLAQGMRNNSTQTIAVVVPDIQNKFFGAIIASMEQSARKRGYALLICNTNENRERELECLEMLAAKQVDGILLGSAFAEKDEIPSRYLKSIFQKFPIVLFDRKINGLPFTSVLTDNYAMAYKCTKYLIGLGHTYISTIGSVKNDTVSNTIIERENGFKAALREVNALQAGNTVRVDWEKPKEMEKKILQLLDYHKVTAVLVLNNSLFAGCQNAFALRKLSCPDNLSIIVWDDEEYDRFLDITAVQQPVRRIGEIAVSSLLDQIEENHGPGEETTITINSKLVTRHSCVIRRD